MTGDDEGLEERRDALLDVYARAKDRYPLGSTYDHSRAYLELPALELRARGEEAPLDRANVEATVAHVRAQDDCTDFGLNALLPMLYRYGGDAAGTLPTDLEADIEDAVRSSAYWFDEPGEHDMWFSTENHQVLWHAAELLAGQRSPDAEFRDGHGGAWHREHAEAHLERWIEWRAKFGFSEWLSNAYYDEDLAALANVAAFAADDDLACRARDLLHLTTVDVAMNTYGGAFGCSHGRSYALDNIDPRRASMAGFCHLVLGAGEHRYCLSRSAVLLALAEYEPPAVVDAVLADLEDRTGEHRGHHGLAVEEAPEYGLDPSMTDDQLFFWGSLAMGHRDVVDASMATVTGSYARRLGEIAPAAAYHRDADAHDRYEPDPNNTAMTGADVYTYRTPQYLLSCAQDFRPGKMGFQQHPWQATVGGENGAANREASGGVPIFTNHPQTEDGVGAWGGNGVLPRAAAHRNVVVSRYDFEPGELPHDIPDVSGWNASMVEAEFTHAFLPRDAFDYVVERDDRVCARRGDAFVCLAATTDLSWGAPHDEVTDPLPYDPGEPYELIAEGGRTTWVCELGTSASHGSFDAFVDGVTGATLAADDGVTYDSPSLGTVEFGSTGPLVVDGEDVSLSGYPRLDSPYVTVDVGTTRYEISCNGESLTLDFDGE